MLYTDELYGTHELPDIIEELIHTQVFQRLKNIHQGGPIFLINPKIDHTRFEHAIGVMLLIKKLGGKEEEQIAGLLHDISHTAFSHLIDYVLEIEEEDYHEKRFEEVLKGEEMKEVLEKYGHSVEDFLDLERFKMLEYPLPSLSIDRIDYTLRDLFQIGQVDLEEIHWFLAGLKVFDERIVVSAKEYADWFRTKYEYLVTEYFEGAENKQAHVVMKDIIQGMLATGQIEEKDFFEDDYNLLNKIGGTEWVIIQMKKKRLGTEQVKTKKRSIDPDILINDRIVRWSELR